MSHGRAQVLVAGVGNVFFGDDGFGVEVANRLLRQPVPEGVEVVDFGIRGRDLSYALVEGYAAVILIDAVQRGGAPGTLYVIEPEVGEGWEPAPTEAHALTPSHVLAAARCLGAVPAHLRLVGCEPAALGSGDEPIEGLSPRVSAAVEPAMALVRGLIAEVAETSHA